jgi:hypothetical protein
MINAEATAEKSPAYNHPCQRMRVRLLHTTHENQRRVQIFIIFLHELLVILFGFFVIVLVKSRTEILLVLWEMLVIASGGFDDVQASRGGGERTQ